MRLMIQTLLILFLGFATTEAKEGYFGQPYFSTSHSNPFKGFYVDSTSLNYFEGESPFHTFSELTDSLHKDSFVEVRDTVFEINKIERSTFGKISGMWFMYPKIKGLYGQDSLVQYLIFKRKDTTISWLPKNAELHKYLTTITDFEYSAGKYWLFGNQNFLLTFDELSLKIDTVPIDGTNLKPYNDNATLTNCYKNGILYFSSQRDRLCFYSKDTSYSINIDSIFNSVSAEYTYPTETAIINDKLYIIDDNLGLYIFDLLSKQTGFVNLKNGEVGEYYKEDLKDVFPALPQICVHKDGTIYLNCYSYSKDKQVVFVADENKSFKQLQYKYFSDNYYALNTPYDYIWLAGSYINPDSDTTYAAVPYFPEGTSVEAVPTMITLRTYPNPTKTQTKVQFYVRPDLVDDLKFTIYDYMGNQIDKLDNEVEYDNSRFNATKTIQSSKYRTGIYYLLIDNGVESKMVGFAVE